MGVAHSKFADLSCFKVQDSSINEKVPMPLPEPPEVHFYFKTSSPVYTTDGTSFTTLDLVLTNRSPHTVTIWPQGDILNLPYALKTTKHLIKYVDTTTRHIINAGGDNSYSNVKTPQQVRKRRLTHDRIDLVTLTPHVPTTISSPLVEGMPCQSKMQSKRSYEIHVDGDQFVTQWALGRAEEVVQKGKPGYCILADKAELKPIRLRYNQRRPVVVQVS